MTPQHQIRADFDRETIVVWQAYKPEIAEPAVAAQRFVEPFSFGRMTWIKPSFLWMMHRSNWAQKSGQERVLAIRITRAGWEKALANATLTSWSRKLHATEAAWREQFKQSLVHVQWDPERTLRGGGLPHRSIQVGISRRLIREYVADWIVAIEDFTPRVRKIYELLHGGRADKAQDQLPPEKVYPVSAALAKRLLIES